MKKLPFIRGIAGIPKSEVIASWQWRVPTLISDIQRVKPRIWKKKMKQGNGKVAVKRNNVIITYTDERYMK